MKIINLIDENDDNDDKNDGAVVEEYQDDTIEGNAIVIDDDGQRALSSGKVLEESSGSATSPSPPTPVKRRGEVPPKLHGFCPQRHRLASFIVDGQSGFGCSLCGVEYVQDGATYEGCRRCEGCQGRQRQHRGDSSRARRRRVMSYVY